MGVAEQARGGYRRRPMGDMTSKARSALDGIERICDGGLGAQELLEEVVVRVTDVIDTEAFFLGATDPETGLCLGAGLVHGMSDQVCQPFWDHEFTVPDYNKFTDLDARRPVGDLYEATGNRPQRSARWRAFHAISDLDSELRAVLHAGNRTWGVLQLNRHSGAPAFTAADRAFLEALAPIAGAGLRAGMLSRPGEIPAGRGPGMLVLDGQGGIVSATDEAAAWLSELPDHWRSTYSMLPVPIEVAALAAASVRAERDEPPRTTRARLRTVQGVWLIAHASPLPGTGQVAVMLEPAKASEVAPIVIEAYGLTPREVDVTRLVAQGLKTEEIGAQLFLSPHTVRDHLKAIFEKTGVKSRGELVSQLFADHYNESLHDALYASSERIAERIAAGV